MSMSTAPVSAEQPSAESVIDERQPTVGHLLRSRIAQSPARIAYSFPSGIAWDELTWAQLGERVWALAAGLIDLGVRHEDRVALASSTRIEWALADYAVLASGAATTTIYPTSISDDVGYIVDDSGCRVVIAEDAGQVAKLREVREIIPGVEHVVVIDPEGVETGDWVISLADVEERGAARLAEEPGVVDERIDATGPEDLACIIYTSGTTGRPKGVRLVHSTWTYQGAAIRAMGLLDEDDVQYLWLPLAHVFAKVLLIVSLDIGLHTAIDGRVEKIVDNLAVVRPTFMAAAPRIFEKVYGSVSLGMAAEGGAKAKIFSWASGVGRQYSRARSEERPVGALLKLQHAVADRLVFAKIRERFGGRVRFFISGSAALNTDVAHWFNGAGLPILEGYGLTENAAAATVARPDAHRVGTVGQPMPRTEVQIAEDGEVLLRGPHTMRGYHGNPEATAEVLTEDGWFHTGDIGEFDERGNLSITDRKKDLFKTSNGKYVAPSLIEAKFKGICPYVGQLLVHGEGRQYVTALVTLDEEALRPWAEANGLRGAGYTEVVSSLQAQEMVQSYIDELNEGLNPHEQIKKFHILGRDLTVEDGELTPSLKLRRKVVATKFQSDIDRLYPGA